MLKNLWALIASSASVDQQTNSLSIFGVIEEITAQPNPGAQLPAVIPLNHAIIALWQKDRGEELQFTIVVEIKGPKGDTIGSFMQPVNMPSQTRRVRTIINLQQFPLVGSGEYHFIIKSADNDTSVEFYKDIPLDVIIPKIEG